MKRLLYVVLSCIILFSNCSKEEINEPKKPEPNGPVQELPKDKNIKSIQVSHLPLKREYVLDEPIDVKGLSVKITYDDRSVSDISEIPVEWVKGYTSNKPVKNLTLTIQPLGNEANPIKTTFTVDILPLRVKNNILISTVASDITEINVPEGIVKIEKEAFGENKVLKKVTLPSTLKEIGDYTFFQCTDLQKVDLSNTIIEILSKGCFESCTNLTEVQLPRSLKTISANAFLDNTALKNIEIHEGLEKIEVTAFQRSGIEKIVLPNTVYSLERSFYSCPSLKEVLTKGEKTYEGTEEARIDGECFQHCKNLKTLQIPNSIKQIGESTVGKCYVERIILPASVNKLLFNAFGHVTTLKEIVLNCPEVINSEGGALPATINTIYVPSTLLDKYKSDPQWKEYESKFKAKQ